MAAGQLALQPLQDIQEPPTYPSAGSGYALFV